MKKIQFTFAAIAITTFSMVFAQESMQSNGQSMMNQDRMASMCQKMHPEMSPDQCKAMRDKMHGGSSGMGAMAHDHGATGDHQQGVENASIGKPGLAKNVTRTIKVGMTDDMKFNPSSVQVKQGETIRFQVKNLGKTKHEMVLGTEQDLKEHYKQMMKFPEMEHAEPNMVTLGAGASGEIIWQFTKAGKVQFACLQPGHYDAGMRGSVSVGGSKAVAPAQKGDGHDSHQH